MITERLQWHFTFSLDPISEVTLEEGHPDLQFIKDYPGATLQSATLIDSSKFSIFRNESDQLNAVVQSIQLPPSKLIRVFRRVEANLTRKINRRIPAFQFQTISANEDKYCFAFLDSVVVTNDSRYFRADWSEDD